MDLKFLMSLGAEVVCGHVAIRHIHVGSMLKDGSVLLTPDGEEYVNSLRTVDAEPAPAPAPKLAKRKVQADDPVDAAKALLGDD